MPSIVFTACGFQPPECTRNLEYIWEKDRIWFRSWKSKSEKQIVKETNHHSIQTLNLAFKCQPHCTVVKTTSHNLNQGVGGPILLLLGRTGVLYAHFKRNTEVKNEWEIEAAWSYPLGRMKGVYPCWAEAGVGQNCRAITKWPIPQNAETFCLRS